MNSVIYAQVPFDVKRAATTYSREHSISLAAAVGSLIEKGIAAEALQARNAELAARVRDLEQELALARSSLEETRRSAAALEDRHRAVTAAYQMASEALERPIGHCQVNGCGVPISGRDLLVSQRCPSCGAELTSLAAPSTTKLDERQYLLLLGALGLLLGMAMLQAKNS